MSLEERLPVQTIVPAMQKKEGPLQLGSQHVLIKDIASLAEIKSMKLRREKGGDKLMEED